MPRTDISRRTALTAGLSVVAAAALGAAAVNRLTGDDTVDAAADLASPFIAYTPGAYFTSPVAGAPVDAARTATFRAFMRSHPDQRGTPYPLINGIGTNKWGTAHALGTATDPIWKLAGGTIPKVCADLRTIGFRAPAWFGQTLSGTSDSPFCVIDTGTGQSVWGAKAKVTSPGVITVGAAGRFRHASNGLDRRNPLSDGPSNERSRGAIPDAMVIRRDLVDHGIASSTGLGHVLHLFLVETDTAAGFCHPMVGAESGKSGFGAEGERIAIDPAVDLTARGLSPAGLVVARTLQTHGAYFGDNSGSKTALKAEQTSASRNPWAGLDFNQRSLTGITWDDFVCIQRP